MSCLPNRPNHYNYYKCTKCYTMYMYLVQTPVHCACELVSNGNKYQEILKLLLQHGGDLYQKDNAGASPLNLLQLNSASLYTTVVQDFCSKHLINYI